MGISIFAKGRIDRMEDIPRLVDELRERAEKEHWTYAILKDDFDDEPHPVSTKFSGEQVISGTLGLQGIVLTVNAKVESLPIVFERNGILTSVVQQLLDPAQPPAERFTFCKTQFGGVDAHVSIIGVLDLLKERYISNLAVDDEGGYWETRDLGLLTHQFNVLQHYLDHVETWVAGIKMSETERRDQATVASVVEKTLLETKRKEIVH
jgi:hypothetical protein